MSTSAGFTNTKLGGRVNDDVGVYYTNAKSVDARHFVATFGPGRQFYRNDLLSIVERNPRIEGKAPDSRWYDPVSRANTAVINAIRSEAPSLYPKFGMVESI